MAREANRCDPQLEEEEGDEASLLTQYKQDFDHLFAELQVKTNQLIAKGDPLSVKYNPDYKDVGDAARLLCVKIKKESDAFFSEPSEDKLKTFKFNCLSAIKTADEQFKIHRGAWSKVHPILKNILGVLAAMLVVPALFVIAKSPHGFCDTFFGNPPTDSSQKLRAFRQGLFEEEDSEEEMTPVND